MTESHALPFGLGALVVIGLYLAGLPAIGGYARSKRQNETLGFTWAGDMGFSDTNYRLVYGIHSGVIGFAVNLVICPVDLFRGRKNTAGSTV